MYPNSLENAEAQFQFHKGTIKTVISSKGINTLTSISIP